MSTNPSRIDLSVLDKNRLGVELLLREKLNLRRDVIFFLTSLERVWKSLPAEMDNKSKTGILIETIHKYMDELEHQSSFIDNQLIRFLSTINKMEAIKAIQQSQECLTKLEEANIKITQQQELIDSLTQEKEEILRREQNCLDQLTTARETIRKYESYEKELEQIKEEIRLVTKKCESYLKDATILLKKLRISWRGEDTRPIITNLLKKIEEILTNTRIQAAK